MVQRNRARSAVGRSGKTLNARIPHDPNTIKRGMDITDVPFNKFIEITSVGQGGSELRLEFSHKLKNHLGTFHAGAQFALAEACSGLILQKHFPHLEGSVLPVLRRAEVKFKKPAVSNIRAKAEIGKEGKEEFERQLSNKGRASIVVAVDVASEDGSVTMSGRYEWFVQKL